MIVHAVGHLGGEHAPDGLDHPFAAGMGGAPGGLHGGGVGGAVFAAVVDPRRRHVHAVAAAGEPEIPGRRLVAETARPEVHADPHEVIFVAEQVDVVVAG